MRNENYRKSDIVREVLGLSVEEWKKLKKEMVNKLLGEQNMNEEEKEAIDKLKSVINNDTGVISDDIQDDEIETILGLINKQQKEIERLKEEGIGDTKFDKLLFSIRMLHFHHYVNDNQFIKMINKLSNENKGE